MAEAVPAVAVTRKRLRNFMIVIVVVGMVALSVGEWRSFWKNPKLGKRPS